MKFDAGTLSDFEKARSLEWLETNGLGGYASGTASGAHSRRYHGLLVAALQPPVGRTVLLSKLDETIVINGRTGDEPDRYELTSNQYPGVIHPAGYKFLVSFEKDLFPQFTYFVGGVELKKTIACVQGENTTVVIYEVVDCLQPFTLELLPLASARDFHSLTHENDSIGKQYLFEDGVFRTLSYHGGAELFISVPKSTFTENQTWYKNFEYSIEQNRGLDFREDLYSHGKFSIKLKKGSVLGIIISADNPQDKSALKLFAAEKKRREKLVDNPTHAAVKRLTITADQFIVRRGNLSTIVAGYHWFADWGRDTMIALPGLCLVTGRFREAKQILQQFAKAVSQGMLPNRFPDYGETPEYNTIDATLWFFNAVYQYFRYADDKTFVKSLLPVLRDIIDWHYKGTRYGIKVDASDELLAGGQEGVQLTWMDAKVGDWVVTPRRGKPVEVNALWYNAIKIMEFFSSSLDKKSLADEFKLRADKIRKSFIEKFWNENQNALYDYIDGDQKNDDLRPNQLYAVSLPFPVLTGDQAEKVLTTVSENLLTPRGLRSLAPTHRDYRPVYAGDVWMRDGSYHQGTVWSFLIGAYIDALFFVRKQNASTEASKIISLFLDHLDEAGIGTISEIFDGDSPHIPRGCIGQAWGVGEILRVIIERDLLQVPRS